MPLKRADRNFAELLQELRVAQTGVQILFAFLLGLAFTDRFAKLGTMERDIYIATLAASAMTGALLVAPVMAHRLLFQRGFKRELVRVGHRFAIAGLCGLLTAIVGGLLWPYALGIWSPCGVKSAQARVSMRAFSLLRTRFSRSPCRFGR
jgi:hypothetical protein